MPSSKENEVVRGEAPSPRPGVLAVDPYVPGRSKLAGAGAVIKLSSNETPLGPSPHAIEAYRAAAARLDRYPDSTYAGSRGAWCCLWAEPGAYRLRQWLGRAVPHPGAGLSGARRRGDLYRARL